jgi:hypothetical protein
MMIKRRGRRKIIITTASCTLSMSGQTGSNGHKDLTWMTRKDCSKVYPWRDKRNGDNCDKDSSRQLRKTRRRQNLCMYNRRQISSTYNCESFRRYTQTTAFLHNNRKEQQQQHTMLLKHLSIDSMLPNWQNDRRWKPTRRRRIRIEFSNTV